VVNLGPDARDDPLVPHFAPLLAAMTDPLLPPGAPTAEAWEAWTDLLGGDGLDPADPRALLVRREVDGRAYESTSASLVALSRHGVGYDFSADPADPAAWHEVALTFRG
jgi:hypothetical protein